MLKIITSDAILRKYFPNAITSVAGETPLFDKVTPFLELAEEWVKMNFTSDATFDYISGCADGAVIKSFTAKVVVCHAFMNAVPALDVVLTPNGFGIVSNSNIAPASKERIERLIDSLEAERDRAIRLLLSTIKEVSAWTESTQFAFFTATLFPNLDICDFFGIREHQWQKYQELRPAVIEIEQLFEEQFIGKEQMDAFRQEQFAPSSTSLLVQTVIRSLRATEVQMLKTRLAATARPCSPPTTLIHIVDNIRNNPDLFPEWHSSKVKDLFTPPIYENKKADRGYWF